MRKKEVLLKIARIPDEEVLAWKMHDFANPGILIRKKKWFRKPEYLVVNSGGTKEDDGHLAFNYIKKNRGLFTTVNPVGMHDKHVREYLETMKKKFNQ